MIEIITLVIVLVLAGLQFWMFNDFQKLMKFNRAMAEIETRMLVRGEVMRHEAHYHANDHAPLYESHQ